VIPPIVLSTIRKLSARRGAQTLFHGAWIYGVKNMDFWSLLSSVD